MPMCSAPATRDPRSPPCDCEDAVCWYSIGRCLSRCSLSMLEQTLGVQPPVGVAFQADEAQLRSIRSRHLRMSRAERACRRLRPGRRPAAVPSPQLRLRSASADQGGYRSGTWPSRNDMSTARPAARNARGSTHMATAQAPGRPEHRRRLAGHECYLDRAGRAGANAPASLAPRRCPGTGPSGSAIRGPCHGPALRRIE
jgi:hypothetical protein